MMRELGHQIGRFKVRRLMKGAGLASKQPGAHAYKVARAERPDIPNLLAREFAVPQPNQVWCGVVWRYHLHVGRWPLALLSGGAGPPYPVGRGLVNV